MQLHAIRESGAPERPLPEGVIVRRAEPADLDAAIMPMATLIWDHQAGPPAFTGLTPPPATELRESWAESFELPDDALFIAELDGQPAGFVLLYPDDPDVGVNVRHLKLSTAATVPELRGQGMGTALTEYALRWATEAGYDRSPPTGACRTCSPRGSGRRAVSGPPSIGSTASSAWVSVVRRRHAEGHGRDAHRLRITASSSPQAATNTRRAGAAPPARRRRPGRCRARGRAPARPRAAPRRRPGRLARRRPSSRRSTHRRTAPAACPPCPRPRPRPARRGDREGGKLGVVSPASGYRRAVEAAQGRCG